jgi:hypothetical protein
VVLLGRAWQLSLPLTLFWHDARLAYSQFSAPLVPLMQNLPVPVTLAVLLPIVLPLSIDDCALAIEMLAIKAATAVNVVNVFMISSMSKRRVSGTIPTRAAKRCSGNSRFVGKKFWNAATAWRIWD